ncbi:MAG TPA: lipocalin-like domain-containing protein [Chloroflexota bacterium]|nr:lipocalin-like domain-containing protein [Chloroflexota bacterium]
MRRWRRAVVALLAVCPALVACARPAAPPPRIVAPDPPPALVQPVTFPRDEAPHDDLTEWWYYTGHLFTDDGGRYGFEFVIFQVVRGDYPVMYVAHMAVTDGPRGRYWHDQRVQRGSQIGRQDGFDLDVDGWRLHGALGSDAIEAAADPYGLQLALSATKPPVLHDGSGYFDYGPVGGSYYYSRTRMAVDGVLQDGDVARAVHGQAWMDHQWGNFLVVGGWDWYSLQLDDQTELMLFFTRAPDGSPGLTFGTAVAADGTAEALHDSDFTVEATGSWTSPHSGATYPSGWRVAVPGQELQLDLAPTQLDQELDTEATVGMAYWEGQVEVHGTRAGDAISGLGYVELTGYASSQRRTAAASSPAANTASSGVP